MARDRVVIIGAGGHGAELGAYCEDIIGAGWDGELLGFLDDAAIGRTAGLAILGKLDAFADCVPKFFEGLCYITAVGNNAVRRAFVERLAAVYGSKMESWTLIHPRAYVGSLVEIGAGSCVAPDSVVTTRVRIGRHCILNVKASISHDCVLGDFVNINPGVTLCGNVSIGKGAYIGAGAIVKDKVTIGVGSIIGAGAVVTTDMPPHVTAVGVPARVIKSNEAIF